MKLWLIICLIYLVNINLIMGQKSVSVFDTLDNSSNDGNDGNNSNNNNNSNNSNNSNNNNSPPPENDQFRFSEANSPPPSANLSPTAENNIQAMLDKLKSKVTNPFLKDNFSIDHLANFFANYVLGNQFVNNLEVKELASLNNVDVKEELKVRGRTEVESLSFKRLKTKPLTIDDSEINFDPEAILKLKNSKIAFKVKDVFEVITFMKYVVKICGSKLEKCDFNTLLKNNNANQLLKIISAFESKQQKFLEKEKEKLLQEEKKRPEKINTGISNKNADSNLRREEKAIANASFKQSKILFDFWIAEKKSTALSSTGPTANEMEKELSNQIKFSQTDGMLNEQYDKFIQNPQVAEFINSYYYDMGGLNQNMNNNNLNNNLNNNMNGNMIGNINMDNLNFNIQ